jgi:cytochrome c oxidase subunit 3/cytochrome o ubiquinol oxidase subunit 3
MSDDATPGATPPEEKTPGHGAPDQGNEPHEHGGPAVDTLEEIPMGGVPEPGPAADAARAADPNQLTELPDHGEHRDEHGGHATTTGLSNNKMAMWLFLGSECLLFGGLISTYMLYRGRHSGSIGPDQIYDIPFTSVSSFVLLMSSLTMVLAVSSVARGDLRNTKLWLVITALLGATFLGGQIYEFTTFYREGLGYTTSLFSSSFYTLTGFHGAHVAIGVVMLLSLVGMIQRNRVTGEKSEVVELVGLYWHFVDIVWIVIFTLVYLIPA